MTGAITSSVAAIVRFQFVCCAPLNDSSPCDNARHLPGWHAPGDARRRELVRTGSGSVEPARGFGRTGGRHEPTGPLDSPNRGRWPPCCVRDTGRSEIAQGVAACRPPRRVLARAARRAPRGPDPGPYHCCHCARVRRRPQAPGLRLLSIPTPASVPDGTALRAYARARVVRHHRTPGTRTPRDGRDEHGTPARQTECPAPAHGADPPVPLRGAAAPRHGGASGRADHDREFPGNLKSRPDEAGAQRRVATFRGDVPPRRGDVAT